MNEKTLPHEEVVKLLTPRALEFYENHKFTIVRHRFIDYAYDIYDENGGICYVDEDKEQLSERFEEWYDIENLEKARANGYPL